MLPHAFAAGVTESSGQLGIGQQAIGELLETGSVADFDQEAGRAVDDQFAIRRDITGDHRQPRGHRFHDAVRLPFEVARNPEEVHESQQRRRVGAMTGESRLTIDFDVTSELHQLVSLRPVADQQQVCVRSQDRD